MKLACFFLVNLFLCSLTAIGQSQASTYNINSLDGISQRISLTDGGAAGDKLTISCGKNKLSVCDFWALESVRVLKKCFLEIKYAKRGGSCVGIGYTLLLCVNKDSLIVSSVFMTRFTGCGAGEDDSYMIKSNLIENKIELYKANIYIHNRKTITNAKLGRSYNKHWAGSLEYDRSNHIFHNGYLTFSGRFLIISCSNRDKRVPVFIDGKFPIITFTGPDLQATTYLYIKEHWYEQGEKNYLIQIS